MSFSLVLPVLASSLLAISAEASMSDRIIPGEILDRRITACGVRIADGKVASVRPFIEAPANLSGIFRTSVVKNSSSGASTMSQGNTFSGGSLGNSVLTFDTPSQISIRMSVQDDKGTILCRLETTTTLGAPKIRT